MAWLFRCKLVDGTEVDGGGVHSQEVGGFEVQCDGGVGDKVLDKEFVVGDEIDLE
jgi:hypothetical protein